MARELQTDKGDRVRNRRWRRHDRIQQRYRLPGPFEKEHDEKMVPILWRKEEDCSVLEADSRVSCDVL